MTEYWTIGINNGEDLLADADGNVIKFVKYKACKEYIEENEIDGFPVSQII